MCILTKTLVLKLPTQVWFQAQGFYKSVYMKTCNIVFYSDLLIVMPTKKTQLKKYIHFEINLMVMCLKTWPVL